MALPSQPQPKSLSEIFEEFKDDIIASELRDLLEAVRTLKHGSGWGGIDLIYTNHELNDVEIRIKRKPKKKT